jgi:hypothetical protein
MVASNMSRFHPTMVRFKVSGAVGALVAFLRFHPTMVRFKVPPGAWNLVGFVCTRPEPGVRGFYLVAGGRMFTPSTVPDRVLGVGFKVRLFGVSGLWLAGLQVGTHNVTERGIYHVYDGGPGTVFAFDPYRTAVPQDVFWPLREDLRGRPGQDNPLTAVSGLVGFSAPGTGRVRWTDRVRSVQRLLERAVLAQELGKPSPVTLVFAPQGTPPNRRGISPVVEGRVELPDDTLGWKAVSGDVWDVRIHLTRKPWFEAVEHDRIAWQFLGADQGWSPDRSLGRSDIPPDVRVEVDAPGNTFTDVFVVQNLPGEGVIDGQSLAWFDSTVTVVNNPSALGGYHVRAVVVPGNPYYPHVWFEVDLRNQLRALLPYVRHVWFIVRGGSLGGALFSLGTYHVIGQSYVPAIVTARVRLVELVPPQGSDPSSGVYITEGPLPIDENTFYLHVETEHDDLVLNRIFWGGLLIRYRLQGSGNLPPSLINGVPGMDTDSGIWYRVGPARWVGELAPVFAAFSRTLGWLRGDPGQFGTVRITWRKRTPVLWPTGPEALSLT